MAKVVFFVIFLILAGLCQAEKSFQRYSALPILAYSEETELQYGAMLLLFAKPWENGTTNELDIAAYGSTKGQFKFTMVPYFFLFNDNITGWLSLDYINWVSYYYGSTNDPDIDNGIRFDKESFVFAGLIQSKLGISQITDKLKYGLAFNFDHNNLDFNSEYKGDLSTPQGQNGWRNALGYHLSLSSYDNENWARHGYRLQWEQLFYNKAFGSNFNFNKQELDLRAYSELFWGTSMAYALLWQRIDGNAPIDYMAGPDGIKRFRGVEDKFFRGNQSLIMQMELRKKLIWRLAGTIFFDAGKVGGYFSDMWRNKWHQAPGFGGQFALNMQESLYARGDISWIDYKQLGITVYIRSAF